MLREYIEFVQRALEGVDQWFVDMVPLLGRSRSRDVMMRGDDG